MTTDPDAPQVSSEEAAAIEAECARDAALRSLIADALALIAFRDPVAVSQMRNAARHCRTGAELGMFEQQPGMDLLAFHTERHDLLEYACGAAGFPHKGADVLAWREPVAGTAIHGPAQILPFRR